MTFDPNVPQILKERQIWFGGILHSPIDADSNIAPIAPSGLPIEEDAARYIAPGPTLPPHKRIELYNQQYWWRLLNNLQDLFPLVTRLFGYQDFNMSLAMPFLQAYPPQSWTLNDIGDRFPDWLKETYRANDRRLVIESAELDLSYHHTFLIPFKPSLSDAGSDAAASMSIRLQWQPCIKLFELGADLFSFRQEFLKHPPEHWIEADFPVLKKDRTYRFILAREKNNQLIWREMSEPEYVLFNRFSTPATIEEVCDWLESQPEALRSAAEVNLAAWLQEWTGKRWLALTS